MAKSFYQILSTAVNLLLVHHGLTIFVCYSGMSETLTKKTFFFFFFWGGGGQHGTLQGGRVYGALGSNIGIPTPDYLIIEKWNGELQVKNNAQVDSGY